MTSSIGVAQQQLSIHPFRPASLRAEKEQERFLKALRIALENAKQNGYLFYHIKGRYPIAMREYREWICPKGAIVHFQFRSNSNIKEGQTETEIIICYAFIEQEKRK